MEGDVFQPRSFETRRIINGELNTMPTFDPALLQMPTDLTEIQRLCHFQSDKNGWWKDLPQIEPQRSFFLATKIALIHSELSEALEGLRTNAQDAHLPQYSSIAVELADALYRILDLAESLNINLNQVWWEKHLYNIMREDHKPANRSKPGGKKF